jgi:hypothetical protein
MLKKEIDILLNEKFNIFNNEELDLFLAQRYESLNQTKINRIKLMNEQNLQLNGITYLSEGYPINLLNEHPYKKGVLLSKGTKFKSNKLIVWCDEDYVSRKIVDQTLKYFLKQFKSQSGYEIVSIQNNLLYDDILDNTRYKSLERFELITQMYNSHLILIPRNSKILNPLLENLVNKNCYYLFTAFSDENLAINHFHKNGITPITINNIKEVIYEISNS